ncbi:MAG: uroporphyrinogen decarboxylase family protein [Oceanipulchritudo sp.]
MIFSPGIYEHAAALIQRTPWEVSRSGALLAEAHRVAWECYHHPLIVAGIDVYNLEPEAYGAVVSEPSGVNIPSISRHPCKEVEDLLQLSPFDPANCPRIRDTLDAGKALTASCPDAQVHIPMCGPFALGIGLLGMNELLMAVVEDPEELKAALGHLLAGQKAFLEAIYQSGLKPIIFESGTTPPLLPVEAFQSIEAPLLKELFDHARSLSGQAPACVIGGDAAQIAKAFLEAGPGWVIAPSETDQTAFLETARAFPDVHVRVNMSATQLLDPSIEKTTSEAERCRSLALTRPNTSVGCGVVPYETDPDTLLTVKSIIENH